VKKILFLILFTPLSIHIFAQEWIVPKKEAIFPAHEFRLGIGYKPFEAAEVVNNIFNWDDQFDGYLIQFDVKDYYRGARFTTNALFGEYTYQANKSIGVGVTAVFFSYFSNYLDEETDATVGFNEVKHFSIYPTLRYTWLNKPKFSLYTSMGWGFRYVVENDILRSVVKNESRYTIAGQFTLFGFTIGKSIYGFSDLSTLGTQGIATIGLGYRFQRSIHR